MKAKRLLYHLKNIMLMIPMKLFYKEYFMFDGRQFKQYVHWYNKTWTNCRAIEIPVFLHMFNTYSGRRILEVGNVIEHYEIVYNHTVLDKYERKLGVINEDIVDYRPEKRFDVVLSCSTLEHVGFDEPEKDPDKFLKAIENIKKNILVSGGVLFFSVPVGYNPGLDRILREKLVHFNDMWCYQRVTGNIWVPCCFDDISHAASGDAVVFCRIVVW